jgi:hypothetical protein
MPLVKKKKKKNLEVKRILKNQNTRHSGRLWVLKKLKIEEIVIKSEFNEKS